MEFKIIYALEVTTSDIPSIDQSNRQMIKLSIDKKLTSNPNLYGKPLRGPFKNYLKLRVGDYRVIFKIKKNIVKIFAIMHRKLIYKKFEKRIE